MFLPGLDDGDSTSSDDSLFAKQLRLPARGGPDDASASSLPSASDDGVQRPPTPRNDRCGAFAGRFLLPPRVFPSSLYADWIPPQPPRREDQVIGHLLEHHDVHMNSSFGAERFTSVDLQDFCIYRHRHVKKGSGKLSGEFVGLQELRSRAANTSYHFDGTIFDAGRRYFVQGVPFGILSIGGYEDAHSATVGDDVWIQSDRGAPEALWYRLKRPAPEYRRFHEPFLWLADFSKHVVDYLHGHGEVTLAMFASHFHAWLEASYPAHPRYRAWQAAYGDSDYRRAVAAHCRFLASHIFDGGGRYERHPVWNEVMPDARNVAIPMQEVTEVQTIVTPYVHSCFRNMSFAGLLKPVRSVLSRPRASGLPKPWISNNSGRLSISAGDVVKLRSDASDISKWKDAQEFWYAYVQRVDAAEGGGLRVLWLSAPCHTTCSTMTYPFANELFMSDHCNCDEPIAIPLAEVVGRVAVSFYGSPEDQHVDFFVRQRFSTHTSDFTTLRREHFHCKCGDEPARTVYDVGDTVLVSGISSSTETLEPVELIESTRDPALRRVRARCLRRRRDDYQRPTAEPNELVYSAIIKTIPVKHIVRRCHVRFYSPEDRDRSRIPVPYSRQGIGDAFYIVCKDQGNGSLIDLGKPYPVSLRQGFDPLGPIAAEKLKGLDLFCGGGNFGRGIEEGGAIEITHAVDYDINALHTYRANLDDPARVKLYLGSVNDYLLLAMEGQRGELVARPGGINIILAGSPCQGFSMANQNRDSIRSLLNISMVASVVSFIDVYRPDYAILENVVAMTCSDKRNGGQNAFSQVLAAIVGLGYQVQQFNLDAWSFAAPQSRSRLFICIAARGLQPLEAPILSHRHPKGTYNKCLGYAVNGLPFGKRDLESPTAFDRVSIGEATADLPLNLDGRDLSVKHPDHRVVSDESFGSRSRIACIPKNVKNATMYTAGQAGLLPERLKDKKSKFWTNRFRNGKGSNAYSRILGTGLTPAIMTKCSAADALNGRMLHWEANRCLTVLESRRAQQYPDRDVLIGTPATQWKIVGNSVARGVSLALGLSLRTCWLANAGRRSQSRSNDLKQDIDDHDETEVHGRQDTVLTKGTVHEPETHFLHSSELPRVGIEETGVLRVYEEEEDTIVVGKPPQKRRKVTPSDDAVTGPPPARVSQSASIRQPYIVRWKQPATPDIMRGAPPSGIEAEQSDQRIPENIVGGRSHPSSYTAANYPENQQPVVSRTEMNADDR